LPLSIVRNNHLDFFSQVASELFVYLRRYLSPLRVPSLPISKVLLWRNHTDVELTDVFTFCGYPLCSPGAVGPFLKRVGEFVGEAEYFVQRLAYFVYHMLCGPDGRPGDTC
jgi:hypothetical protein